MVTLFCSALTLVTEGELNSLLRPELLGPKPVFPRLKTVSTFKLNPSYYGHLSNWYSEILIRVMEQNRECCLKSKISHFVWKILGFPLLKEGSWLLERFFTWKFSLPLSIASRNSCIAFQIPKLQTQDWLALTLLCPFLEVSGEWMLIKLERGGGITL